MPQKAATADRRVIAYPLGDALYLNLTSACTLACTFCPKIRDDDWVVGGFDLRLRSPPSADDVWRAIEDALRRIDDGNYGRCEACGGPLGLQRIRAIPEARFCLTCSADRARTG